MRPILSLVITFDDSGSRLRSLRRMLIKVRELADALTPYCWADLVCRCAYFVAAKRLSRCSLEIKQPDQRTPLNQFANCLTIALQCHVAYPRPRLATGSCLSRFRSPSRSSSSESRLSRRFGQGLGAAPA